ncbi:hypothetical protein [Bowmanella sp. JS7-9]|uniref:Transposase n=1 Tax=Pseudobowmanella zhangzhouensis TaxID=1537679 RepID=A0ABW1XMV2_9ALTE|nr:hypothetical protein [Bowmanella sp. JS7-9]TBX22522.1 hypothetical protein TK45_08740 [Bowmanella sp. JS7-9]
MVSKSFTAHLQDELERQAEVAAEEQREEFAALIGRLGEINSRAESLKAEILRRRELKRQTASGV